MIQWLHEMKGHVKQILTTLLASTDLLTQTCALQCPLVTLITTQTRWTKGKFPFWAQWGKMVREFTILLRTMGFTYIASFWDFFHLLFCEFFVIFRDRVSLCSPGYPRTHYIDQADLELESSCLSPVMPPANHLLFF